MAHNLDKIGVKTDTSIVCYAPAMITTNGIWQGDNPLDYSLPLFILQLTLIVSTTRLLVFVLKPLHQPRVVSEILVLDEKAFAMMVLAALVMTALITPIITIIYRPTRRSVQYKRRTIQRSKPDSELRLLACIHTPKNVPTVINLLEASHPNKKSPLGVYVLHLVELTGRASAMLIVHNTRKPNRPTLNRDQAQSDHIVNAFENYEEQAGFVSVQPLTAISPYSTMHEDICNLAEDKRVSFIILPFHKQQTVDGGMEETNPAFRGVNQNVLTNAPCSVGILVDRGLSGQVSRHVVVLFFGGPDDREALAYGWRMGRDPETNLTVIRFLSGEEPDRQPDDPRVLKVVTNCGKEKQLDEEYLNKFKTRTSGDESIAYADKVVNHAEEVVAAIRSIEGSYGDLYIVGRGGQETSPLTEGLTDWSECPELGAIGDLLASSDFASNVSVLVVQQYVGMGPQGEGAGTPDSAGPRIENINQPFTREPVFSSQITRPTSS